jgi:hypothetical protein
MDQDSKRIK